MQNVHNAAEIKQRVINLVELYRTKVGKESDIAKEAKADDEWWNQENLRLALEARETGEDFFGGVYGEGPHTEQWIKHLQVNEQLLGHFYAEVAGEEADKNVLKQLLPDYYDMTIFSDEEEAFLKSQFQKMVNYIIQTPCDDLEWVHRHDGKDVYLLPIEVLELIKSRVQIPEGSTIYNPFSGFAQFTSLFPNCYFICEDSESSYHERWNNYCDRLRAETNQIEEKQEVRLLWAWMKIALYANGINATVIEDNTIPQEFDASIAFVSSFNRAIPDSVYGHFEQNPYDSEQIVRIEGAYKNLKDHGTMVLILPNDYCWKKDKWSPLSSLWELLVQEGSIKEIIQLPQIMSKSHYSLKDYCIIVVEKGRKEDSTTFIDARFASQKSENDLFHYTLDLDAFFAMLQNGGKEQSSGLSKKADVPSFATDPALMVPQVYVVEGPSGETSPVMLSELCSLVTTRVYDVTFDLPEDTPWVFVSNLSAAYVGPLDINKVLKANLPNNPTGWRFGKKTLSWFEGGGISSKERQISVYRNCRYVDGEHDAVLFQLTSDGILTALIKASGKGFAVNPDIHVIHPSSSIDAISLLSLLNLPVVYRQLSAYEEFGLYNSNGHLSNILVPTDKRIINDEIQRMRIEESVTEVLKNKYTLLKAEYINEVRMRKHDMGQYIFELFNIEDLMRYYINNRDTESDYCQQIESLLDNFRTSLGELSSLLDNLSSEELFGEPQYLRPDEVFAGLGKRHKSEGYRIEYSFNRDALKEYNYKTTGVADENDFLLPVMYVAPDDIRRVINNILDNARKHGFTDPDRKDYVVKVRWSIDVQKNMFLIDFRNNGNPLPNGMNKMRYGLKGEKAGKTGGTGIGGNYIKAFVEHYGGDYDVFMEDGWTVIRLLLPIKID